MKGFSGVVSWLLLLTMTANAQLKSTGIYTEQYAGVNTGVKVSSGIWVPLTLATAGIALEYLSSDSRWWQNKYGIQSRALNAFSGYNSQMDDYLQFAPIMLTFGLNAAYGSDMAVFKQQSKRLLLAELVCLSTVNVLKWKTGQLRPDGSSANSFPSGHTAQAFLAARFLDKEYGENMPWIRWLGYSMATTTGVCRIIKNRHWASDVLLGAGIGFLSVDLSYLIFRKRKGKKLVLLPSSTIDTYGVAVSYTF
ncbi:MAG: phosphatase PAP2 family protein [Bacteroidales bacterium]|nr:phosphatase PAP2 family protein [Bacteroidales bacterium]